MRLIIDDVGEMNLIMMALGLLRRRFKVTPENFYLHEAVAKLKVKVAKSSDMTYIEMMVHEDVWLDMSEEFWRIADPVNVLYEEDDYVE